jgi:hypothetical protein
MTSKYELNGVQSFKVLDYEVFKIWANYLIIVNIYNCNKIFNIY